MLSVGYRNAPEHPFPAALDDVLDTYRWLLATGTDPATVASTSEILLDDATRLADRARRAGVDVTLHHADGVPHVGHLFADALPEAVDALVDLALWLDDRVSG